MLAGLASLDRVWVDHGPGVSLDGLCLLPDEETMSATAAPASEVFLRYGIAGEDLDDICHAIARTYITRTDSALGDRWHDLAQWLAQTACVRVRTYDPRLSTIRTWLWTQLEPSCYQWHRRKAEGFGDSRYNQHHRVTLTDMPESNRDDYEFDFEEMISSDRVESWKAAASSVGWDLRGWILITLDRAARDLADKETE